MVRLAHVLLLALAAWFWACALPASAQSCWVAPGMYVDTDPGAAVSPGLVITVAGMPCWADVRLLAQPGQPFDPATKSFYESGLEPLQGPPPYDKPNGCPYEAGDPVDVKDQYDIWYPGRVASASAGCGYLIDYWVGQQQKSFSAYHADLRAATLPMPDLTEPVPVDPANPNPQPQVIVQACTDGVRVGDLRGDDPDSVLQHAMIDAINARQGPATDFSVTFEDVIEGQSAVATPGGDVSRHYQDAAANAVIRRFRMMLSLCEEDKLYGGPPSVVRYRYDQTCYQDIFGELTCVIDNARNMN